jgi:hypothetical protein
VVNSGEPPGGWPGPFPGGDAQESSGDQELWAKLLVEGPDIPAGIDPTWREAMLERTFAGEYDPDDRAWQDLLPVWGHTASDPASSAVAYHDGGDPVDDGRSPAEVEAGLHPEHVDPGDQGLDHGVDHGVHHGLDQGLDDGLHGPLTHHGPDPDPDPWI